MILNPCVVLIHASGVCPGTNISQNNYTVEVTLWRKRLTYELVCTFHLKVQTGYINLQVCFYSHLFQAVSRHCFLPLEL